MRNIVKSIYPSLIWTGIIFWLLTMDTSHTGKNSLLKSIPHYDKLIHFGIFAVFSFFWGNYWAARKQKQLQLLMFLVFLLGSVYGMVMEFYQLYFTNRSFSWGDGLADAIGAALGAWIVIKKPLWK